jgi:hypothetical protein
MSRWLGTSDFASIFSNEIGAAGGKVSSVIESDGTVFARSILRGSIDAGPGDKLKGGVAMYAGGTDVFVHPYTFRVVCSNGAIMAKATQTWHISREDWFLDPQCEGDLEASFRSAVRACCEREAFSAAAGQMRSAKSAAADMLLTISGHFRGRGASFPKSLWNEILRRYEQATDPSAYGLMNAVTSVARDTRDPQTKWRLEELGGSIPAMVRRPAPAPSRRRVMQLV